MKIKGPRNLVLIFLLEGEFISSKVTKMLISTDMRPYVGQFCCRKTLYPEGIEKGAPYTKSIITKYDKDKTFEPEAKILVIIPREKSESPEIRF